MSFFKRQRKYHSNIRITLVKLHNWCNSGIVYINMNFFSFKMNFSLHRCRYIAAACLIISQFSLYHLFNWHALSELLSVLFSYNSSSRIDHINPHTHLLVRDTFSFIQTKPPRGSSWFKLGQGRSNGFKWSLVVSRVPGHLPSRTFPDRNWSKRSACGQQSKLRLATILGTLIFLFFSS